LLSRIAPFSAAAAAAMKSIAALTAALGAVLASPVGAVKVRRLSGGHSSAVVAPGTIQQVVTMLEDMLAKTKDEGKKDDEAYKKFKCYCDDNEKEKTESVADLTKQIALLENDIAGLQASTGGLSMDCAKLKSDMDENKKARDEAEAMRKQEAEEFVKTETDLKAAIEQLGQAIDVLAEIGADQSLSASAEHEEFMAGYKEGGGASLIKLQQNVRQALLAAGSFIAPAQRKTLEALLQMKKAPIGGAYASQAGGVVGILKGMKETFETNLESATAQEKKAQKAHDDYMKTKQDEWDTMDGSYQKKQGSLGTNDGDLATKKASAETARTQLDEDKEFLAKLEDMCGDKAKDYDKRVELRASEEAAITEAIAILSSDHASGAFGKVEATSFVQLHSARRRVRGSTAAGSQRSEARRVLHEAAMKAKDTRIARIAGLLALGNPFTVVLAEVEKINDLLDKEAKQDLEQKTWCEDARKKSNENLEAKKSQVKTLEGDVATLEKAIDHPETGLIKMIADNEKSLEENAKAQADETEARREENQAYQEVIANCMSAKAILERAISALSQYYKAAAKKAAEDEELGFVQRQDPAPPATWEGEYTGQSSTGKKVIGMLEDLLAETGKEADTAHGDESTAQGEYEDSMVELKDAEKQTKEDLAKNKEELAKKKVELENKRVDLEKTEDEKRAIERYLEEIKQGCDWIIDNYSTRETNRATEKAALDKAVSLIKGTSAFKSAAAKDSDEALGECKDTCKADEANVKCKACLAEVSVPGYCAGHPGTPGC